ncbi:KAP family P-loop NTPase fold protein [Burkholderia gladioli]|uniref:KAP family P-loop NTPase fold protein n=1 Tax=Burkholderia gladioli TaxID=28095 RepID=UPI00163F8970|nr:P-loop NTPase fold protein [Burkholderia gladioli]
MTNTIAQPLTLPAQSLSDDVAPFDGDLLRRSALAHRIEQFLPRLRNGAVIAIDSQWGGGKTWFGMNWAKSLRTAGHKVAFINAFEQDYSEDPFLPIAAELSALLDGTDGRGKKFVKKAAAVAAACLPLGTKVAVSMGSKFVFGGLNVSSELMEAIKKAESNSEELVQNWVQGKLENYKKERESISEFRAALVEMANKQDKPVIVFVDELDRCRPDFAVRLVERIKHFFETPNVVFILLIHREQLNRAIAGVYGPATEGAAYLAKFVHFFFTLPDVNTQSYIGLVLQRLGFDERSTVADRFAQSLAMWQATLGLTMRDIERGCALFAYARIQGAEGLLAYLIALKLKRPDIFDGMLSSDRNAFKDAQNWINSARVAQANNESVIAASSYFENLNLMHAIQLGEDVSPPSGEVTVGPRFNFNFLGSSVRATSVPEAFRLYLRQIDLPIE